MTPSLKEPFSTLQRLKGNATLLPVYAAVTAEIRKCMDDWIPTPAIEAFRAFARSHGLAVVEDCIFEPLIDSREIDSLASSPTTHAHGLPLSDLAHASPAASVHVFLSRRREWAEEALGSSTYPVVIARDRLLVRPRVDASRLGAAFGYPACCIESFQQRNNWRLSSHFSQAYKGAETVDWRANCLPRSTPLMTIFHVPCGPGCAASITMSQQVLEAVDELDPNYGQAIRDALKGIFLVVNEAVAYKLQGAVVEEGGAVAFQRAWSVVPMRRIRPPQTERIARILESARWVEVADGIITTRNGEERFYEVHPSTDWVEEPCLVRFE